MTRKGKNASPLSEKGKKKGQKQAAGGRERSGGQAAPSSIRPDPVNPTKGRGQEETDPLPGWREPPQPALDAG